jgi:hypothetical protein
MVLMRLVMLYYFSCASPSYQALQQWVSFHASCVHFGNVYVYSPMISRILRASDPSALNASTALAYSSIAPGDELPGMVLASAFRFRLRIFSWKWSSSVLTRFLLADVAVECFRWFVMNVHRASAASGWLAMEMRGGRAPVGFKKEMSSVSP